MLNCFTTQSKQSIPIIPITLARWDLWLEKQTSTNKQWLHTVNFVPKPGSIALLPGSEGQLKQVLIILNNESDFWSFDCLPCVLPKGQYHYTEVTDKALLCRASMAWGLGAYEFTCYKTSTRALVQLVLPVAIDADLLKAKVEAIYRVRDLINTPTEDLGPAELAESVVQLSKKFHASVTQIIGDKLLTENYPAIHAVGRASSREPRLIDLRWGDPKNPKVTLVGKGVCFDSGGLNLKPGSSMSFMKKDMGGAAKLKCAMV